MDERVRTLACEHEFPDRSPCGAPAFLICHEDAPLVICERHWPAPDRLRTAYHEAAHAAVAHALGYLLLRVSIVPNLERGEPGVCEYENPLVENGLELTDPTMSGRIHHSVIIQMAGGSAEDI